MSAYSQQRQATVPHGGSHLGLCAEADRRHVQGKRTAVVIVSRASVVVDAVSPAERGLFMKKNCGPKAKTG